MKTIKLLFVGISFLFSFSYCEPVDVNPVPNNELQYVGIPSDEFNYFSSSQQQSQWCWAASIQMVLNYYGISITQQEIVARTYGTDYFGNLPDWAGSFEAITANLNYYGYDVYGDYYQVESAVYYGAPNVRFLLEELRNGRPVIIGYQTGQTSGHAVVITAASYIETQYGPVLQSIVVRDPWPTWQNVQNLGRVEYPAGNLGSLIQAHWYIRVN